MTTKRCESILMLMIDTLVWMGVFCDRTGNVRAELVTLTITMLELLFSRGLEDITP
jgi:hypothetical protein